MPEFFYSIKKEGTPASFRAHLTSMQRRAYVVADNKLALNAGWDLETLSPATITCRVSLGRVPAPRVAASGRCRSVSKPSITLAGTEAVLANLLRDQLSRVRAER